MDISTLRLSSDMYSADLPGGYSAHADYFEAWDPGVRDAFTLTCVRQALDCHSHVVGDGREIY